MKVGIQLYTATDQERGTVVRPKRVTKRKKNDAENVGRKSRTRRAAVQHFVLGSGAYQSSSSIPLHVGVPSWSVLDSANILNNKRESLARFKSETISLRCSV